MGAPFTLLISCILGRSPNNNDNSYISELLSDSESILLSQHLLETHIYTIEKYFHFQCLVGILRLIQLPRCWLEERFHHCHRHLVLERPVESFWKFMAPSKHRGQNYSQQQKNPQESRCEFLGEIPKAII